MTARLTAAIAAGLLPACHPAGPPGGLFVSVKVEKRADHLTYASGSAAPYTGKVVGFTPGGTRDISQTFLDGKAHGTWLRFWPTGPVKREEIWENGVQTHQRQWYANGSLKEDVPMKNGLANGTVRFWWPDGRVRRMAFMESPQGPHGQVLEYAEDGTLLVDAIFDHGLYLSGLRLHQDPAKPVTAQLD